MALDQIQSVYEKECAELGFNPLSRNKMGVIIHRLYSSVLLRPQAINEHSINCYINFQMCTAMEHKVANPVSHVPAHFLPQPNEHEIRGYTIPTLWQRDGQVASFCLKYQWKLEFITCISLDNA